MPQGERPKSLENTRVSDGVVASDSRDSSNTGETSIFCLFVLIMKCHTKLNF